MMLKSLAIGAPILALLALADQQALESGHGGEEYALVGQQPLRDATPPGAFLLPSFGVKVSWKPDDAGKKKENEQDDYAKPQIPPSSPPSRPDGKPQSVATVTASAGGTGTGTSDPEADKQRKREQEELKKKRDEELKKKREQEELKKKREQEDLKKKREQEDLKKKREQEELKKKKEQEDLKKREQDSKKKEQEEQAKKKDQEKNPGSNLPKKKRNPVPIKYQVPSSAGIAGVGGGSLPDPGFVLEPGDLFQKAKASAGAMLMPNTQLLLKVLLALALVLIV